MTLKNFELRSGKLTMHPQAVEASTNVSCKARSFFVTLQVTFRVATGAAVVG
jgi:hypothetical protein